MPNYFLTHLATLLVVLSVWTVRAQESAKVTVTQEPDVTTLAQQLSHADVAERRKAAYALNDVGKNAARALRQLIAALDDEDDQVWTQSVMTIAKIGPQATLAIPRLIEDLHGSRGRSSEQRSHRAAFALGAIGPAALPAVREYLEKEPSNQGRHGAMEMIAHLGALGKPALRDVLPLLGDEDETVSREAAEVLVSFGSDSVAFLVTALDDASATTRRQAVYALGRLGEQSAEVRQPLLERNAIETDLGVRCQLLSTLVQIGTDPELTAPIVIEALLDETPALQDAAFDAMSLIEPPSQIVRPLAALLSTSQPEPRHRAALALGLLGERAAEAAPALVSASVKESDDSLTQALIRIGPAALPGVLDHLQSVSMEQMTDDYWALQVAKALAVRGRSILEERFEDSSPAIRLVLLAVYRDDQKAPKAMRGLVLRSLDDPDVAVRAAALGNLSTAGLKPTERTESLKRALADPSDRVRAAAVAELQGLPESENARHLLIERLDDESDLVRLAAVKALGALEKEAREAVPRLAALLKDTSPALRLACLQTLTRIGQEASPALPQLTVIAEKADAITRAEILACFGAIGEGAREALPIVTSSLGDPDATVRARALDAYSLMETDKTRVLEVMSKALDDPSGTTVLPAVKALGRLGTDGREAAPRLITLISNEQIREDVLDALRLIDYDKPDIYIQALKNEDAGVRLFACDRLGKLGPKALEALPALNEVLNDRLSFVARRAREAIRSIQK